MKAKRNGKGKSMFHYDEEPSWNYGAIVFADWFGDLRAIRSVGVVNGIEQWKVRCRCGTVLVVDGRDLLKKWKMKCQDPKHNSILENQRKNREQKNK